MGSSGNTNNDLMLNMIRDKLLDVNGPLYHFYNIMYGGPYTMYSGTSEFTFHPAVSGYTLVFMKPPHLSGYANLGRVAVGVEDLQDITKLITFIAVDFTPPSIQVTASELPSRSGSLPYATEVSGTGQLSISFLDDAQEHNFGFHKIWTSYIEDITRGRTTADELDIKPDDMYNTPEGERFGELDYATSAYVVTFKPVEGTTPGDDILYIGKATGIFPINSPDKEIIGRRDSPELVTVTYNYPCANYRQWTAGAAYDYDHYLYEEFLKDIFTQYGTGQVVNGYSGNIGGFK